MEIERESRGTQDQTWEESVQALVKQLASVNPAVRKRARGALVAIGHSAVGPLTKVLHGSHDLLSWEACKTLATIADPISIPDLIRALEWDSLDIRWLAADGLIAIGTPVIRPLLKALVDRAYAASILPGAHRVLHKLVRRNPSHRLDLVLEAMASPEPGVSVPIAAERVLIESSKFPFHAH
jgi:HEAT repeat protein